MEVRTQSHSGKNRDKIRIFRSLIKVVDRCQPAKFLKVTNEVPLIIVAAIGCQFSPPEISASLNLVERALEPPHPAKYFWCHPNLIVEEFDEVSWTQTYLVRNVTDAHALRLANEIIERIPHSRMS